jgi:hypothetical protein
MMSPYRAIYTPIGLTNTAAKHLNLNATQSLTPSNVASECSKNHEDLLLTICAHCGSATHHRLLRVPEFLLALQHSRTMQKAGDCPFRDCSNCTGCRTFASVCNPRTFETSGKCGIAGHT